MVAAATGPTSMAEALERFLPSCENNPHKVAERLDTLHRRGEVGLLAGKALVAPGSNPRMLGVVAHVLSDGKAVLYVQVRQGLVGNYPVWDGKDVECLKEHHRFWAFERESFEALLSAKRGGRPKIYGPEDRERVLVEAAMALHEEGIPTPLTEDGLANVVSVRMGNNSPGDTLLKEILKPLYKRLKGVTRKR